VRTPLPAAKLFQVEAFRQASKRDEIPERNAGSSTNRGQISRQPDRGTKRSQPLPSPRNLASYRSKMTRIKFRSDRASESSDTAIPLMGWAAAILNRSHFTITAGRSGCIKITLK